MQPGVRWRSVGPRRGQQGGETRPRRLGHATAITEGSLRGWQRVCTMLVREVTTRRARARVARRPPNPRARVYRAERPAGSPGLRTG